MPLRVGHQPALVRAGLADVAAVEAVVDLGIAVLVEVDGVAITARVEAEDGVGLVVEAAVGIGVGNHGRGGEAQHRGKRQRHVVGHPHVDLVAVVAAGRPDLDGGRDVVCRLADAPAEAVGMVGTRGGTAVGAAPVSRRIQQAEQRVHRCLASGGVDHGAGHRGVAAGWQQFLRPGEGAGIRGVLHIATLEVQPAGVQSQGDDPEQGRGRKGDDDQALRALTFA